MTTVLADGGRAVKKAVSQLLPQLFHVFKVAVEAVAAESLSCVIDVERRLGLQPDEAVEDLKVHNTAGISAVLELLGFTAAELQCQRTQGGSPPLQPDGEQFMCGLQWRRGGNGCWRRGPVCGWRCRWPGGCWRSRARVGRRWPRIGGARCCALPLWLRGVSDQAGGNSCGHPRTSTCPAYGCAVSSCGFSPCGRPTAASSVFPAGA